MREYGIVCEGHSDIPKIKAHLYPTEVTHLEIRQYRACTELGLVNAPLPTLKHYVDAAIQAF